MNKELTIFLLIIWIAFCLINLMEGIYQDNKENNIKKLNGDNNDNVPENTNDNKLLCI
jgi:hypothetical protein